MFYGWYIVSACVVISAYYSGAVYLGFTAAFEPLVQEFGWSYTQISFVSSLRGMEVGLLVPVAGILMDRWGPRRLVMAGAIISGIGLICLSRVNSLLMFYAAFLLVAAGLSTSTTTLLMAAVTSWFDKRVGLATGITASGVSVGGLLIPFVTRMIDSLGWRQAMFFMGIGMFLIPMPLALFLRHRPEQYGCRPDGAGDVPECAGVSGNSGNAASVTVAGSSARTALKTPIFWIISILFLCQVLPVSAIATHIMPFFSTVGIDRNTASLIAALLPVMTVVGRVGFGWLGDRVGKQEVTIVAMILSGIGPLLFAFAAPDRHGLILAFVVIFGIGWGGAVPMLNGLMRQYFGRTHIASVVGFAGSVMMVGMMIGAPLAGWIFDRTGRYQPAWFLFSAVVIAATLVFVIFTRDKKPRSMPGA